MSIILGVDPGLYGAFAWYDTDQQRLLKTLPMPLRDPEMVFSTNNRKQIDGAVLAKALAPTNVDLVILEHAASSPQMGVSSAFNYGEGFGLIRGILAAYNFPTRLVQPAVWKAACRLSSNKEQSVALACSLFPEWAATFSSKAQRKSADLAEAAILAHYGQRFLVKKN